MFGKFYTTGNIEVDEMGRLFGTLKASVSPAQFQNHLLKFKHNSTKALRNIEDLCTSQTPKHYEGKTIIYRFDSRRGETWMPFGSGKPSRPWHTIVTQNNIKEDIFDDVKDFLDSEELYLRRGISHRKGYILYGPPGTGKSTLIHGLAGRLGYSLCVVDLSDTNMSDCDLINQMAAVPAQSIILIEDVDVALPSKDRKKQIKDEKEKQNDYSPSSRLTLSGVLNALDGVCTTSAQIVLMTTNHIKHLDPALIRPGR